MQDFVVETDTGKAHILQAHGLRLAGPAEVMLVDENDCEIAFFSGVEAAYPRAQNAEAGEAVFPNASRFEWQDLHGVTGWLCVGTASGLSSEEGNTEVLSFFRQSDGRKFVLAARDTRQQVSVRRRDEG